MRYALYFTPGPDDPLTKAASAWLGRDAFSGASIDQRPAGDLDGAAIGAITSDPRRYGFHATLKAPFRLSPDVTEHDLVQALEAFAAQNATVTVPDMMVGNIDGFFALITRSPNRSLNEFAAKVVRDFEPYRAPLTQTDIARRNPGALSSAHLDNLHEWGYPYVFDDFTFHMTLTNRIPEKDRDDVASALELAIAPSLAIPFAVDAIALFTQAAPEAPFLVHTHLKLGAPSQEKFA